MQRSFSTFPGRWPGVGLLLLRVVAGGVAVADGAACLLNAAGQPATVWLAGLAAIAGGASLVVGFLTPGGGAAAAVTIAFIAMVQPASAMFLDTVGALLVTTVAAALVLLGPGAISLDARLFGRREIVFPHDSARPSH